MKKILFYVILLNITACGLFADTVCWWRFTEGPLGWQVQHGGKPEGEFYPGALDSSGNGNDLSVWSEGDSGFAYRNDLPDSTIPQSNQSNYFSIQNTGSNPAMFTSSSFMSTFTPGSFTIEASIKPEAGDYRTIVGRDSYGSVQYQGGNTQERLAALYLQITPDDAVAIKFCDIEGYWHVAQSANGLINGFPFPNVQSGHWYHIAAVSDGDILKLYLNDIDANSGYQLVAQTDMRSSGSNNRSLSAGVGSGSNWSAGNWSVGRGLYNNKHTDRAYGLIDEIRISDSALQPDDFLFSADKEYVPCQELLSGDLNQDCSVDLTDFIIFVQAWLDCGFVNCSSY